MRLCFKEMLLYSKVLFIGNNHVIYIKILIKLLRAKININNLFLFLQETYSLYNSTQ